MRVFTVLVFILALGLAASEVVKLDSSSQPKLVRRVDPSISFSYILPG